MENELKERDVLQKALGMLQKKTGLTATAEVYPKVLKDAHQPDARIRLTFRELQWNFAAKIKKIVTRTTLGGTIPQLRKFHEKGLLVAGYITPQLAEQLKEMKIPFIDTAGNAYIDEPPCLYSSKVTSLMKITAKIVQRERSNRPGCRSYLLSCANQV